MFVKNLVKVGLSDGEGGGGCPIGFLLGRGDFAMNVIAKKYCVSQQVLNLFQDLFVSCLKIFVGVGTQDKPLVRTNNSSSVNMRSEKLRIMFFLYWEVYALIELVVNLQNEDLHWFTGKRTFIDGGVYMRFNGGVGSRIISSVFMWFCVSLWTQNVSSCIRGI